VRNIFAIICLFCLNTFADDTITRSLLNRVVLRDSITDAILGVKYPNGVENDDCDLPFLHFSIEENDSGLFIVQLSPVGSGYIGGCLPSFNHEKYSIKKNPSLEIENKKYSEYWKRIDKSQEDINRKIKLLTKHSLKLNAPICAVIDSLGTDFKIGHYQQCDAIRGYDGGYALHYNGFTLVFTCLRMYYCYLKNIYSADEKIPEKPCDIYMDNDKTVVVQSLFEFCKKH
jgi:hypothetical protein